MQPAALRRCSARRAEEQPPTPLLQATLLRQAARDAQRARSRMQRATRAALVRRHGPPCPHLFASSARAACKRARSLATPAAPSPPVPRGRAAAARAARSASRCDYGARSSGCRACAPLHERRRLHPPPSRDADPDDEAHRRLLRRGAGGSHVREYGERRRRRDVCPVGCGQHGRHGCRARGGGGGGGAALRQCHVPRSIFYSDAVTLTVPRTLRRESL